MTNTPSKFGFPAWAAPGLGTLVGSYLAYATLLQNEPVSPLSPSATLALGAGIGCLAGVLVGLREQGRG